MSTISILPCAILSSIIVLFLIMVGIAIILFENLLNQLKESLIISSLNELEKWKHNYISICQFVSEINKCFGIVLLIELCFGFISFVSYSFNIVYPYEITVQTIGSYCGLLLFEVFHLFLIMFLSFRLEIEVGQFNLYKCINL